MPKTKFDDAADAPTWLVAVADSDAPPNSDCVVLMVGVLLMTVKLAASGDESVNVVDPLLPLR